MVEQMTKWIIEADKAGTCLEVTAVGHQSQLFGGDPVQMLNVKSIAGKIVMVTEAEYEAARKAAKEMMKNA